jgi:DNA-binding NarL/FixJ family response regulator
MGNTSVGRLTEPPDVAPRSAGPVARLGSAIASRLRVGWIDPFRLTRECLSEAFSRLQFQLTIVPFESVRDCIERAEQPFDLIVYHSHEGDSVCMDNIAMLRRTFRAVPFIVLSDSESRPTTLMRAMTGGALGFIPTRTTGLQMVVAAISRVKSGGDLIPLDSQFDDGPPEPDLQPAKDVTHVRLTSRETAVLLLLKEGKANKIVAYELGMKESTVKVHVHNIMRKMGVTNRTQAAFKAYKYLPNQEPPGVGKDLPPGPRLSWPPDDRSCGYYF